MGESRYSLEEAFPATAHARALAEAAGDRTLTLEEEVVEINRQIEKLGEADEAEAVQMLDAELLAEEEAASGESPKAAEEAPKDGEGSPRAEVPAEAKADAGGGEAASGRELDALRVRAAELDDRLRAKGLRKAERAKISEELSGVRARMDELSGGNLVLFSKGEAAEGRPALSPTKAALRDRLLLKIAQTAGIRVIREGTEKILKSSRNAELRMRLGGYMGTAWSARANDALERGLRPAPMVAEELGVSAEAVEVHMHSPEWHHVGEDFEEVRFFDPDEAPLTDAKDVRDAETAQSFLTYVDMFNYDTRTFTVKPRVAGRFESEASDEAYALFTNRSTAVAKDAFAAADKLRALIEGGTATAEELRVAAEEAAAAAKSGRKASDAAAKAFLSEHKDWRRVRPRRARRGANGLRYSLEEAFPATEAERAEIERSAKAKGTWLKAPNGNPSNLTPEQWVTVRTRAFKKWFGDWEKSATLAKSFREEDSNANIIRVERDGYTDEFRRIQEESNRLSQEDVAQFHRSSKQLTEDERLALGRVYERLLAGSGNARNDVWTDLTGKGNTFRIARVNGELFHDIFEVNRKYLPNGELVDLHDDYSNAKCFLTDDGMCGFAVEEGGNLVSVFSLNPNKIPERTGFLYAIRDFAREQGATHLDAYASNKQNLEAIYAKTLGFHVAAEMDYAMEYDHDDIAANHGKPKVVFMVDSAAAERRKFDDYDAAVAYQRGATSAASAASASKVVDENGEPLVVYHGTREHFYEFEHGRAFGSGDIYGYLGHAFYATNDYETAESYADGGYKRTLGLFLNIRNPYETKNPDHTSPAHDGSFAKHLGVSPREVSPTLRQMGHDGVIATDEEAGYIEYAFYHSTQAKSATENVGTFDAGNPDIRYSLGGGARVLRAWHGSPHAFDAEEGAPFGRFGLSFVGTGEGAQAFGYGIYLTSEEDIARHNYAQRLGDDDVAAAQRALGRFGLAWATFRADELAACVSFSDFKRELRAAAWSLEDLVEEGEMTAEELASDKASIREATKTREAFDALLSAMLATQDYFYESRREDIERALEEAGDGRKAKALREELERFDELKREADANERPRHHLYEARIRVADDASNLLDWVARPSEEQLERIRAGLRERGVSEEAAVRLTEPGSFGEIYRGISEELGGAAKASETLKAAGFAGHKYPADSVGTGAADYSRGTNYVIYDTGATEITDAVRWLRNDSGVVYGYWDEGSGELHLNEDFADFDTPLHEWAHVWLSWVRKADARLAERALAVTKETKFYKRLREDKGSAYAGLSDDALAEEAFAMLCGKDGGVPVLRVSSVAFDFAENFLQAANRGEGIVVPADGAHDGKVPRAGAEHGGQPRFVDPADGDGGTRRGVDHRAHGLQAQRRIGNFLGRRGVDGADADVVGSGGTRGSRLRERMRGEPENFQRREAFPCGGQRHVVLPEMHAVGLRFRGDFRIVVHDEERARSRSDAANVFRGFDDAFPRRALHAQLNETQACAHGCVRAGFITRRGIRDDEVKAEGIFHKEKKKNAGARGLRAASHGVPAVVVFQRFKSSAMMRASLRPLLSMPPKIGPMRKPPCTLFAAMPEA